MTFTKGEAALLAGLVCLIFWYGLVILAVHMVDAALSIFGG